MIKNNSKKDFTLVELLVVIAIIGILSSVVLISLNSARARARDAKRISDLKQLETALALYYDANGSYPSTGGIYWGNCSDYGSQNPFIPNLVPAYVAVLPSDPNPVSTYGCYIYRSNATDYMLLAYYTVESYTTSNNPMKRPSYPNEPDFAVYSAGGSGW